MMGVAEAIGDVFIIFCVAVTCFAALTSFAVGSVCIYRWSKRGYAEELNDVAEIGRMKERIQA